MQNPTTFYKKQIHLLTTSLKSQHKTLSLLSLFRVVVFLAIVYASYVFFGKWQIMLLFWVVGGALFLLLLSRYSDLKYRRGLLQRLVLINEEELEIQKGRIDKRPTGLEYQDQDHFYSLDIDLFGRGSFFQHLNRTAIKEGTDTLAAILLSNNTEGISDRQLAIRELSGLPEWMQNYTATAQGVETEYSAVAIITWLQSYQPFLKKIHRWFALTFSGVSLGLIVFSMFGLLPVSFAGYWLLLGLGISAFFLKKISTLALQTGRAKDTFRQYAMLLKQIESMSFKSQLLKSKQGQIAQETESASAIFTKFSKILDALDNRNNLISAVLGNGLFLWDLKQAYKIERWIASYGSKVKDWFDVVTFFDAYNTLGVYAFNHQEFVYPDIVEGTEMINALDLGHPQLNKQKRISSDLKIDNTQFFIVTGANMAGKSTFLRTVGLHIVMANVGLPVCATSSAYKPVKLISSMRTTDSLTDDSSYFFSELTRLKFVVDTVAEGNYFVILDEILKGTNSTDKAIGSRKFVQKLLSLEATGMIATHDLSLTEIAEESSLVKNYFFDAQIINNELFFDYKLKPGVCENMNASFLLQKMDII